MLFQKLTAEQRLTKACVDVMGHIDFVAIGGVLTIGKRTITDNPAVPTARTNGRDEEYSRPFIDSLSGPELRFVVLHENYHKMYQHLTSWQGLYKQDADRANRACDYVINLQLAQTSAHRTGFIQIPAGGLLDYQYIDANTKKVMTAKQVFDLLPPTNQQQQQQSKSGNGECLDQHDWEGAKAIPAEEREEMAKDIDEAMRQGAILAAKMGSGGARQFEDLLQPKQDWTELMRQFVSATCSGHDISTWRKVNRRYIGMDIYMPGAISETVGDIVIAIDTSGSIGQTEITTFMSEVTGIVKQVRPERVHLLYWDTEVCRAEVYLPDEYDTLARTTKPAGGGGTDVFCVCNHLRKNNLRPACVIVFSDGYVGNWGSWDVPVLWAIINNSYARPSVGTTIHLEV